MVLSISRHWLSALKELIFPRNCIVCDSFLNEWESSVCNECMFDIPLTYYWNWTDNPAKQRLNKLFPATNAVSLFFYRHESGYAEIIRKIKYEGDRKLGYKMGRILGKYMADSRNFTNIDAIIPVPLHFARKFKRGYNQAEIIAAGIAKELNIPLITDLLKRKKMTSTQVRLNHTERYSNVANAFTASPKAELKLKKKGIRHILIFDDVLTTGATISAAATPLINSFEISAASLATVE